MSQRVVDLLRPRTRIEAGSAEFPADPERCAVVVQFSTSARLTRSFTTLVEQLHENGYFVVVSSACEADGDLEWPGGAMPGDTIVIRKPNVGYDFGTAAVALDRYPQLASAPFLLIVNDSNVGPFRPLAPVIASFESAELDAWSLTASEQHGYHLQSFFLGFRGGILTHRPLRAFWRDVRHFDEKDRVIRAYELGLSRLLFAEGYTFEAMYAPSDYDATEAHNLSVNLWRQLLDDGYPFVKREIVNKPWIEPTAPRVPAVVHHLFEEDVAEWL